MKKGLIIKLTIVLVVLALSYCVFWFFKAGQSEKQINKFISDNSSNISAGEISVSGFPISQKIVINDLKITLPINLLAKRQIHIKKLEANSGIFSSDFSIILSEGVKVQDLENVGEIFDIEFASQPEIMASLSDGVLSKLQYSDSGFKVLDTEKNVVNSSAGTNITSETSVDETEKRISKIRISFKDLEGYAIIDLYKNLMEKKVIEGIKTEEIKVNNVVANNIVNQEISVAFDAKTSANGSTNIETHIAENTANKNPVANQAVANQGAPITPPNNQPSKDGMEAAKKAMAIATRMAQNAPESGVAPSNQNNNAPTNNVANNPQANNAQTNNTQANNTQANNAQANNAQANIQGNSGAQANQANPQDLAPAQDANNPQIANPELATDQVADKNNVTIDLTLSLTPSVKQESDVPSDPTQIQELPVQYVRNIKIDNIEFSNPSYKINVSGDITSSSDDNLPSGGVTVKVEKIANLLQQLKIDFKKLSELKKPSAPEGGSDIGSEVQSAQVPNYDIFLHNVSEKISEVATEIALKNSVSKDDISQFDIRREKNLEFLVNEVPLREIIGKF